MSSPVYDSAVTSRSLRSQLEELWRYRDLLRLVVLRDVTVRYKRSVLGASWTLINPLLTAGVTWLVFSQVFRFAIPGVPFIVYVLSGILLVTYFGQSVLAAGAAIIASSSVLTKVYVPGEIFSIAAVIAGAVNFALGIVPLLLIQLITGTGIPWTVVLVPVPIAALVLLICGVGLVVAALAVLFYDVLDMAGVLVQLLVYLTPAFYPLTIVPDHLQWFVVANPVFSHLRVFRCLVYEGTLPPITPFAVMLLSAATSFVFGVWVFNRAWRRLVVLL